MAFFVSINSSEKNPAKKNEVDLSIDACLNGWTVWDTAAHLNQDSRFSFSKLWSSFEDFKKAYLFHSKKCKRPIQDWTKNDLRNWSRKANDHWPKTPELVAILKRAVILCLNKIPSDAQIFSLIVMQCETRGKGWAVELPSCNEVPLVAIMMAAIQALKRKKVDLILPPGTEDGNCLNKFFEILSLKSSNVAGYQESHVIYGSVSDFMSGILARRPHDVMVTAELDSLLLSSLCSSVHQGPPIQDPEMERLNFLFAVIFSQISRLAETIQSNSVTKETLNREYPSSIDNSKDEMQTEVKKLYSEVSTEVSNPNVEATIQMKRRHSETPKKVKNGIGSVQTDVKITNSEHQTELLQGKGAGLKNIAEAVQSQIKTNIEGTNEADTLFDDDQAEENISRSSITVDQNANWDKVRAFLFDHVKKYAKLCLSEMSEKEMAMYRLYCEIMAEMQQMQIKSKVETCEHSTVVAVETLEVCTRQMHSLAWKKKYPVVEIPSTLKEYVLSQLDNFIDNALNAFGVYIEGCHYSVHNQSIARIGSSMLELDMPWGDGLLQLLQLKHGLPVTPIDATLNVDSNVAFFKKYQHLYGLSNCLGGGEEFLRVVYDVDSVAIPPCSSRPNMSYSWVECAPDSFSETAEWYAGILTVAIQQANLNNSVLVFCRYPKQVEHLVRVLKASCGENRVFSYVESDSMFEKEIDGGEIVVTSSLVGIDKYIKRCLYPMYIVVAFEMKQRPKLQLLDCLIVREANKNQSVVDFAYLETENTLQPATTSIEEAQRIVLIYELNEAFRLFESRFIPLACERGKDPEWHSLKIEWVQYSNDVLKSKSASNEIAENVAEFKASAIRKIYRLPENTLKSYSMEKYSELLVSGVEEAMKTFIDEKLKNTIFEFLSKHKRTNLMQDEAFYSFFYDWGLPERRSLRERWFFWLRDQHFEEREVHPKMAASLFEEFSKDVEEAIQMNRFHHNPHTSILKGCEYLQRKMPNRAMECFDRALKKTQDVSHTYMPCFARYNKAIALVSCGRIEEAIKELIIARKEVLKCQYGIVGILQCGLLSFNKQLPTLFLQHTIATSQLLPYIDAAHKALCDWTNSKKRKKLKVEFNNVDGTLLNVNSDNVLHVAISNGMSQVMTFRGMKPIPWGSVTFLGALSTVQIVAGAFFFAFSAGTVGAVLVIEGVTDLFFSVKGSFKREIDWKKWAMCKIIGIAISILTLGVSGVVSACKCLEKACLNILHMSLPPKASIMLTVEVVLKTLSKTALKEGALVAGSYLITEAAAAILKYSIDSFVEKSLISSLEKNELLKRALKVDARRGIKHFRSQFEEDARSFFKTRKAELRLLYDSVAEVVAKRAESIISKGIATLTDLPHLLHNVRTFTDNFIKYFNKMVELKKPEIEAREAELPAENNIILPLGYTVPVIVERFHLPPREAQFKEELISPLKSLVETFKMWITDHLTNATYNDLFNPVARLGLGYAAAGAVGHVSDFVHSHTDGDITHHDPHDRHDHSNVPYTSQSGRPSTTISKPITSGKIGAIGVPSSKAAGASTSAHSGADHHSSGDYQFPDVHGLFVMVDELDQLCEGDDEPSEMEDETFCAKDSRDKKSGN